MKEILVHSIVGMMTQEPLVQVTLGEERVQMSPSEARDVALNLLEASQTAITDLYLVTFLMNRVGVEMNQAGQLLNEFRQWRSQRDTENEPGEERE